MIRYKMELSKQELDTLIEMQLQSPGNKKRRKYSRVVLAIAMILMLLDLVLSIRLRVMSYTVMSFVLFAVIAWFATVGLYACQKLVLKKMQSRLDKRMTSGEREYGFDQDGVVVWSDFSYSEIQWKGITEWGTFKDCIYLKVVNEQTILIRKEKLSEEDREELVALLMEHVKLAEN